MLVYFVAIWYILQPFGTFFPFWYVAARKSGNPGTLHFIITQF
jgi:hypothetical protein